MRKSLRTVFLMSLMLAPVVAYGDSHGMFQYATTSADGKYLFVMLFPGSRPGGPSKIWVDAGDHSKYIEAEYPASGLYLNDGSITPLWTVEWWARSVLVPSDGVHLIRRGPWAMEPCDEALAFLSHGKLLRSYRISDVVETTAIVPHTISHFYWEKSRTLNERNHTLELVTLSKEKYTFDYTSGEILSSRRPLRVLVVIVVLTALVGAALLIRRTRVTIKTT